MSDLISRSETIQILTEDWFLDILLTQTGKSELKKILNDKINRLPTAYDVDKVVTALEYHKDDFASFPEDSVYALAIERAIDTVKEGGRDD